MARMIRMDSISDYNRIRGVKTVHPLITVIDASTAERTPPGNYNFGLYCIFLKELKCGELKYGRSHYDYQEGTLVFLGPGQVVGVPEHGDKPKGWALLIHPDLIRGTSLGWEIGSYGFFSYEVNEALHISEDERKMVVEQFIKIRQELASTLDAHSKKIIIVNLELLLHYFTRFYDRQFITREHVNQGVVEKFEAMLAEYFTSDMPRSYGLPTVGYFAKALNLSPNYFGDLIKRETGTSPLERIQLKVIDLAKEKILDIDSSIAEVGYDLGFKYPQHFTRLFRQKTGITPKEYRLGLN